MWRAACALQARHAVWRLLGVGCLRTAFPGIASCALVVCLCASAAQRLRRVGISADFVANTDLTPHHVTVLLRTAHTHDTCDHQSDDGGNCPEK